MSEKFQFLRGLSCLRDSNFTLLSVRASFVQISLSEDDINRVQIIYPFNFHLLEMESGNRSCVHREGIADSPGGHMGNRLKIRLIRSHHDEFFHFRSFKSSLNE